MPRLTWCWSVAGGAILSAIVAAGSLAMASDRSLIAPVEDRIIHLSADLSIGPKRAFAYFTDSKLLRSWLALDADVEAKVGGKYELFWEPANHEDNSTIGCRVTALSEGELIAFPWRSPKQYKPFANGADPLTHVVVIFMATPSGTRVHLIHSGWRSTHEWEEARQWQERAWTGALEQLKKIAAAPAQ